MSGIQLWVSHVDGECSGDSEKDEILILVEKKQLWNFLLHDISVY